MDGILNLNSLSPSEVKFLRKLKNPEGIQKFLDSIPYHLADTAFSPRNVMKHKTAHCLEGAIFAAAALRINGYPPLILDLEADRDTDHVIAVYKHKNAWGAIASSNYSGCRFRAPIYRNFRELALSYFEDYFSPRKERSLRRFSKPVNLARFDDLNWMTTNKPVWFIAEYLVDIPHTELLSKSQKLGLPKMDERSIRAGLVGHKKRR